MKIISQMSQLFEGKDDITNDQYRRINNDQFQSYTKVYRGLIWPFFSGVFSIFKASVVLSPEVNLFKRVPKDGRGWLLPR